ncbi:MAG TPA: flagellar basal body P-ring formation chaperone FlgA [Bryobacteraceae bacterium]|nr:flagellar basal body P-ring formation chaperone FlgA [Bryobacteraceae bacterium]
MIFTILLAAVLPAAGCHPINAERIYARDLAAAVPLFSSLPPDFPVGYSPAPGWQRTFHVAELQRLAKANHLEGAIAHDVCFGWAMSVPDPDRIVEAMKKSLAGRDVHIEIVDRSRMPAPAGELVFPLSSASVRSSAPVLWRGYVTYGDHKRFGIWASVMLTVKGTRVVAVNPLHTDVPIEAADVREESYEGPLQAIGVVADLKEAVGMVPRRPVGAGEPLLENLLDHPRDISRGDTVEVVVNAEGAMVRTAGIAEESGNRGATIVVRNATSGRRFHARVEDKGKVSVVPGVAAGLIAKDQKS